VPAAKSFCMLCGRVILEPVLNFKADDFVCKTCYPSSVVAPASKAASSKRRGNKAKVALSSVPAVTEQMENTTLSSVPAVTEQMENTALRLGAVESIAMSASGRKDNSGMYLAEEFTGIDNYFEGGDTDRDFNMDDYDLDDDDGDKEAMSDEESKGNVSESKENEADDPNKTTGSANVRNNLQNTKKKSTCQNNSKKETG